MRYNLTNVILNKKLPDIVKITKANNYLEINSIYAE